MLSLMVFWRLSHTPSERDNRLTNRLNCEQIALRPAGVWRAKMWQKCPASVFVQRHLYLFSMVPLSTLTTPDSTGQHLLTDLPELWSSSQSGVDVCWSLVVFVLTAMWLWWAVFCSGWVCAFVLFPTMYFIIDSIFRAVEAKVDPSFCSSHKAT